METQMLTPTPGGDYPRTWNEFLDWFATEEACQAFLEKLKAAAIRVATCWAREDLVSSVPMKKSARSAAKATKPTISFPTRWHGQAIEPKAARE